MKKKISFEIETDKDNGMVEAYLKYSLKMLKIENIRIEKELGENRTKNTGFGRSYEDWSKEKEKELGENYWKDKYRKLKLGKGK